MADAKIGRDSKKIRLTGIVQGVGFRPYVYRLAVEHNITGYVKNVSGSLEIVATGVGKDLEAFIHAVIKLPPEHARIESAIVSNEPHFFMNGFIICESGGDICGSRFFSPDLALCNICRDEVFDENNRRHRHFFNNCVSCGPRFSVLTAFPYDRKNTSMNAFVMCPDCDAEYTKPSDRRFHAETIACRFCGPKLFFRHGEALAEGEDAFSQAVEVLKRGEIVAIKGIGGYHFACLPSESSTILRLRARKGRDYKPFAIMFRDIAGIQQVSEPAEADIALLTSSAHPIVLLPVKGHPFAPEALSGSARCGCFLPYTPLHAMLMKEIPRLIMTSANISSAPIIMDDTEMLAKWDYVLYNDRKIIRGIEDSVAQTVHGGKTQIIRRGRGYSPLSVETENPSGKNILAMGSDLKASFSLADGKFCTLSPYIGDLENTGIIRRYRESIYEHIKLFGIEPEIIVCDRHPRYFSSHIAKKVAEEFHVPLVTISHHHAHIASVIAEKKLTSKVIGVSFDGGGYGDDGNIWGGEFLTCENGECHRVAHLEYTALIGADAAAKDARATAACFLNKYSLPFAHPHGEILSAGLKSGVGTFLSSSIGRLFDAVSSILGLCHENSYEGQCAAALQYHGENAYRSGKPGAKVSFTLRDVDGAIIIGQSDIIENACKHAKNNMSEAFALGFHFALADMVLEVCKIIREREGASQVALSGGVFQNTLLLSLCADMLSRGGFYVYFNSLVPPNDGGLALGQSYIAAFNF